MTSKTIIRQHAGSIIAPKPRALTEATLPLFTALRLARGLADWRLTTEPAGRPHDPETADRARLILQLAPALNELLDAEVAVASVLDGPTARRADIDLVVAWLCEAWPGFNAAARPGAVIGMAEVIAVEVADRGWSAPLLAAGALRAGARCRFTPCAAEVLDHVAAAAAAAAEAGKTLDRAIRTRVTAEEIVCALDGLPDTDLDSVPF